MKTEIIKTIEGNTYELSYIGDEVINISIIASGFDMLFIFTIFVGVFIVGFIVGNTWDY